MVGRTGLARAKTRGQDIRDVPWVVLAKAGPREGPGTPRGNRNTEQDKAGGGCQAVQLGLRAGTGLHRDLLS